MRSSDTSVADLKAQARRLKQSLEKVGKSLTHSQALETIATMNGYKDWNHAAAAADDGPKLYVLCCSYEFDADEDENMGFFQYVMRAPSLGMVVDLFKEQMREMMENDQNGTQMRKLYLDRIIQFDSLDHQGVPLNLMIPMKDGGHLGCDTPFTKPKNVQVLIYSPNGEPDEETRTLEPVLTF